VQDNRYPGKHKATARIWSSVDVLPPSLQTCFRAFAGALKCLKCKSAPALTTRTVHPGYRPNNVHFVTVVSLHEMDDWYLILSGMTGVLPPLGQRHANKSN
jgi:hypothetical protein